jgi:hypothetical protein
MNILNPIAWILMLLLINGCASSPPSPTVGNKQDLIPEKTVTTRSGADKNFIILRQPGGAQDQSGLNPPTYGADKTSYREASSRACPPGQLMATRIISGETGTRISEECVTPFASKERRFSQPRTMPVNAR